MELTTKMQNTFNQKPKQIIQRGRHQIFDFDVASTGNIDIVTVKSFGEEWKKFASFSETEINRIGNDYFDIVPVEAYHNKLVLDVGCGTGRWSKYVSSKAAFVEAIDPSEAVYSAAHLLVENRNVRISRASVDNIPFLDNSFDLVFSLGVLHHIPDTEDAMKKCIAKVKRGGYFLVYLYYNLDNRGFIFRALFNLSNLVRRLVSVMPARMKKFTCDMLAFLIYIPFVSMSRFFKFLGFTKMASKIPLSWYADKSLNVIRNDSLDRFGTPLEKRFSRKEIETMMKRCGLTGIVFSEKAPYWHAMGQKR